MDRSLLAPAADAVLGILVVEYDTGCLRRPAHLDPRTGLLSGRYPATIFGSVGAVVARRFEYLGRNLTVESSGDGGYAIADRDVARVFRREAVAA